MFTPVPTEMITKNYLSPLIFKKFFRVARDVTSSALCVSFKYTAVPRASPRANFPFVKAGNSSPEADSGRVRVTCVEGDL